MSITRRHFAGLGLSGLAAYRQGLAQQRKRPNILFLLPDQLRAQALGCMGDPNVKSPNIDLLAAEGLLMRNTIANTPVCCPARAIMLTGRYAHSNGMVANDLRLRESEVTIAEVLKDAGYRTGFIGKWHLDGGPRLPGFVPPGPRRQGFEWWAANECSHAHFATHYFRDSDRPIPINKFEAEGWADLAIEFLRGSKSDPRPFFLTVQMGPPHDPYKAPPEYSRRYDPKKLILRPNYKPGPRVPDRAQLAEYYAMITAVDDQVGRILAVLDELSLAEDTIVLLSSDHGDMLGSHGQRLKRKPWEESIRVPGILRYPPRIKAGRTSDVLCTHVDFAPTLLSLCGVKPPVSMQGTDLSKVITGESTTGPDSAFLQIFGPYHGDGTPGAWRGVRTSRYVYARFKDQPWVLYDLKEDPYEMKNLAADPAAGAIRRSMEAKLSEWMKKTGDSWSVNWSYPVEDNGRLYSGGTFYTVEEYLKSIGQAR